MWHERLGHVNIRAIKDLIEKNLVRGIRLSEKDDFFCKACPIGKAHRLTFNRDSEKRSTVPGEVVHTDHCGPMSVDSIGGAVIFSDSQR